MSHLTKLGMDSIEENFADSFLTMSKVGDDTSKTVETIDTFQTSVVAPNSNKEFDPEDTVRSKNYEKVGNE